MNKLNLKENELVDWLFGDIEKENKKFKQKKFREF